MTASFETLRIEQKQPHTLLIILNRPEAANALSTQMGLDLLALFDGINAAPASQRCIVLTGSGARAFCAGWYSRIALAR